QSERARSWSRRLGSTPRSAPGPGRAGRHWSNRQSDRSTNRSRASADLLAVQILSAQQRGFSEQRDRFAGAVQVSHVGRQRGRGLVGEWLQVELLSALGLYLTRRAEELGG